MKTPLNSKTYNTKIGNIAGTSYLQSSDLFSLKRYNPKKRMHLVFFSLER